MDAVTIVAGLCRRFEGFMARPYLCSAGVATIGYGATYYEDGRRVKLTDEPITRERAEALLMHHIRTVYLPQVIALCPHVDTAERVAALTDFAFNCGTGDLKTSTLRKRVNAEEWHDVPAQLMRWNKAGGLVLRGLTIRRQAEAALV